MGVKWTKEQMSEGCGIRPVQQVTTVSWVFPVDRKVQTSEVMGKNLTY